jgi:hypothetical protein
LSVNLFSCLLSYLEWSNIPITSIAAASRLYAKVIKPGLEGVGSLFLRLADVDSHDVGLINDEHVNSWAYQLGKTLLSISDKLAGAVT